MLMYTLDKVKLDRISENIWRWLAWKLPRRLVMWATVRAVAFATQGKYSNTVVPELPAIEAVKRWDAG